MYRISVCPAVVFILFILAGACYGNDLDDGISIDDNPISHYDNVDRDINITYIKMQAKTHAKINSDEVNGKDAVVSKDPTGSINSVVSGAGSTFKGDIIIIDESKGDKTIVVE